MCKDDILNVGIEQDFSASHAGSMRYIASESSMGFGRQEGICLCMYGLTEVCPLRSLCTRTRDFDAVTAAARYTVVSCADYNPVDVRQDTPNA